MSSPQLVRMIFGLRVSKDEAPTSLEVAGSFGAPEPQLSVRRSDGWAQQVSWLDPGWKLELAEGDYVVTMLVDTWQAGALAVTAINTTGATTFVYYGLLPDTGLNELAAWPAAVTLVDPPATSSSGDPKDPWPPPPPPVVRTKLSGTTWLENELHTAWSDLQPQLAAAGGRGFAMG